MLIEDTAAESFGDDASVPRWLLRLACGGSKRDETCEECHQHCCLQNCEPTKNNYPTDVLL
jgi:hypothetical protein